MGPTIQRGVIQCPVQQKPQSVAAESISKNVLHLRERQQSSSILQDQDQDRGNHTSDPQQNGRGRLPGNEVDMNPDDHVVDSARGYKSFPLNEIARPVFVNHYYGGESVAMNRKFIRLEDCDVSVESSMLN